ncbi:cell wall-binding repeat-containing protein [Herbiconiux liukaitaii]|uniref:cell wall-binding repeat-containing protein n=1 Tax=Herbiconiux liukaitaii TaxID=3342799 RepID=UPI0035B6D06D
MNTSTIPASVERRGIPKLAGLVVALGVGLATFAAPLGTDAASGAVPEPEIADVFPNSGTSEYEVSHYDIDLDYYAKNAISATTTIEALTEEELISFSLDLQGLAVNAVSVDGAPAGWTRNIDYGTDTHKLRIIPSTPVTGDFVVTVSYSGAPEITRDADGSQEGWMQTPDGVSALGQPLGSRTWFPNNNTPADKATYALHVTTPDANETGPLSAASVGSLDSRESNPADGTTTWNWSVQTPTAPELIALSIGNFDVLEGDVELASGTVLKEWTFLDSGLPQWVKDQANGQRSQFKPILDWLESKLGPYPGSSIGVIVDPAANYALETQERPYFPWTVDQDTLIHELVHQWLGNSVSPANFSNIWLNEGGAEFYTDYYNSDTGATDLPVEDTHFASWRDISAGDGRWNLPSAGWTNPADLYGWQVYTRSNYALNALLVAIGHDDFDRLFAEWVHRFGGGSVTTADFVALAEEVSGRDLSAFFDDWVYSGGKPAWPAEYAVSLVSDVEGKELDAGDTGALELSVQNVGQVALENSNVSLESAALLQHVTLPEPLPTGVSVEGSTPVWTIPALQPGENAQLTLPFTVRADSSNADIEITAVSTQLGSQVDPAVVTFTTSEAPPAPGLEVNRIAGADRYEVSVNTSKAGFPAGASTVYVASGAVFPDALSAAPAAATAGAPILLTTKDELPASVAAEITRLGASKIVIVGGPATVSTTVETTLKALGTVTRIGGADRFEASRNIAKAAFPDGTPTAVLVAGTTFADALSAGAAIDGNGPVILVNGTEPTLDAATKQLLTDLDVKSIAIAGGPASVSAGIETTAQSIAPTVRLGGADRYETSRSINAYLFSEADHVLLATGQTFPDALSGSAYGPSIDAPLFTVTPDCIPAATLAQIKSLGATKITLLGGTATLSAAVENLTTCTP